MIVNNQKNIIIKNDCDAIFEEKELIEAILWYSDKPVTRIKTVYMHGEYPAVSIYEKKIHIHRLLMMYWLQSEIPTGYLVHHNNRNKLDARKENLSIVSVSYHQSYHNKGKSISEQQKEQIRKSNRTRKGKRRDYYKKDVSPEYVYQLKESGLSFNQISKILKLDWGCVVKRYKDFIHNNPELLEVGE